MGWRRAILRKSFTVLVTMLVAVASTQLESFLGRASSTGQHCSRNGTRCCCPDVCKRKNTGCHQRAAKQHPQSTSLCHRKTQSDKHADADQSLAVAICSLSGCGSDQHVALKTSDQNWHLPEPAVFVTSKTAWELVRLPGPAPYASRKTSPPDPPPKSLQCS